MKNIRNNSLKVMVMVSLFCSVAFADGEMGGGGLYDAGNDGRTAKTVIIRTTEDGEMGGGGKLTDSTYLDAVMSSIYDYFDWMI